MGLEQVKKEILDKASQEAKNITQKGQAEAKEILDKTNKEIREYRTKVIEDTKKLEEAMERRVIAAAEFDVKKMKLDKKKEMIEKAFDNVKSKLGKLDDKNKEKNIKKLLAKAKKEIEVKYLHGNPADKKIINRIKGVEYRETDITGGIVAESKDLSFSVDMSYDELLDEIRKKHLQEIADKLFS